MIKDKLQKFGKIENTLQVSLCSSFLNNMKGKQYPVVTINKQGDYIRYWLSSEINKAAVLGSTRMLSFGNVIIQTRCVTIIVLCGYKAG